MSAIILELYQSALSQTSVCSPHISGKSGGEVTVPIVETKVNTAKELQKSPARGVTKHGHRGNRGEPNHSVRTILFSGIDIGNRHYLQDLVPVNSSKTALAPEPVDIFFFFPCFSEDFPMQ